MAEKKSGVIRYGVLIADSNLILMALFFPFLQDFTPPTKNYGERWDGKVHLNLFEKEVSIKSFDCETLEELKIKVEEYINQVAFTLENAFAKMG